MRYAHTGVEGELQTRFAAEFADLVREKTGGGIDLQVYPASQLGGMNEVIEGVSSGVISFSHHDFAALGKILPDMTVFSAPYLYRDAEHALKATNPETSPVLRELNELLVRESGIRVIGSFYRGVRHLTCNFPVYSPADLAGKNIRGIPLKLWLSMIEGMGAIPTSVAMSEVAIALMTGVVSGQENPLNNIYASKLYEVQSHLIMTGHMHSVLCVFVNDRKWQEIEEGDRKTIQAALQEISLKTLEWDSESESILKNKLVEEGMTIIDEGNGLKLDEFRNSILEKVAGDFPEWSDLIKMIQEIR